MYKIKFEAQPRQGTPDYESGSIILTKEQYEKLPYLSGDIFDETCQIHSVTFREPTRHSNIFFPAIRISHDEWELKDDTEDSGGYMDPRIFWFFVCLDKAADIWIAFDFYDLATLEDTYTSTVGVSFPTHGDIYRLDEKCKEIVRKFY